ncbi:leucine-rich repeat protein [Ruminococcus flavefaciens]|uniref:leucine-rich repeat protein n=1 Tax=Ruminococcus flavefaciens TaxID=1265 RepID=UPI0026F324E4|nr:leucine-rich repeat protein [Ruminococcus flavefaciens]
MYPVSQNYLAAIESGNIQHLKCTIRELSGTEHILGYGVQDDEIVGTPTINRQCVEDPEAFAFGQLYVGTAEITVSMTGISEEVFRSGELELRFGVEVSGSSEPEWVPLGIWDISEAVCTSKSGETRQIRITALDRLERLKRKCSYTGIGLLYLETIMEIIAEDTGLEFAQTASEVLALIGKPRGLVFRAKMSETCWDEVKQISQLIGGFACTDRQGRIVFRTFAQDPVLTIPASKRHSAQISENSYALNSVTYSAEGYSHTEAAYYSAYGGTVAFSDNGYIFGFDETDYVEVFRSWLRPIIHNFEGVNWFPGTINYYGDPALDLGDMIYVTDGVAGERKKFLICAETWQFRGPQTLIAAGQAESGISSSDGGGTSSSISVPVTNITVSKAINTIELEKLKGSLYEAERTAALGAYSCKATTCCFVNVSLVLLAEEDCTAEAAVYHDEVVQDFRPMLDLHAGEYSTLTFTVPITAAAGEHTVRVAACGKAELTDISAHIWGQELTGKSPEYTSASDYTYTIEDGAATVTGYHGDSLYPEIPPRFEGAVTAVIGAEAFTDSEITSVYIPEGVTEIRSVSGSLPSEYEQVEYLESSGTQYIDTGWRYDIGSPSQKQTNYNIQCKCSCSENYSVFGNRDCFNLTGASGFMKFRGYTDHSGDVVRTDVPIGNAPVEWQYNNEILYADGVQKGELSRGYGSGFGTPIYLFCRYSGYWGEEVEDMGGTVRIYNFSVSENPAGSPDRVTPIVDLWPCVRKSDGKPGMYDLVSGNFLVNIGTGEFTCGEKISSGTGAFMNAQNLAHVYIPRTCELIGEWAFTNTALNTVRIPADCTYFETSFPPDCEVQFYGGGGDYGQLYDGEEYALIDSEGALIYAKE